MAREIKLDFWVNDDEYMRIRQKMIQAGVSNMSAYIRKMVMDGYTVKLDMPELQSLITAVNRVGGNINQITRRVNGTGCLFNDDISEIQKTQAQIYQALNRLISKITEIY